MRSGTAPAPNYGEARGAESQADFVHKLAIVLKGLNETSIWLRIIGRSGILRESLLVRLVQENNELCKILTASLKNRSWSANKMKNGKCRMENVFA